MRLFPLILLSSISISAIGEELFLECRDANSDGKEFTSIIMIDKANSKGSVSKNGIVEEYELMVTQAEYILTQPDWQVNIDRRNLGWSYVWKKFPTIFANNKFYPCKIMKKEETLI
jgi:hypothetical protein